MLGITIDPRGSMGTHIKRRDSKTYHVRIRRKEGEGLGLGCPRV